MKYFSKIKKAVVRTLLAVSLLLAIGGLAACGNGKGKVPELFGFDVKETITVEQHGLVFPENVHVTDADGTMYDVVVTVRDSKGNKISTDEGNKFNATDAGGYTITYSIETWDFSIEKTVKVKVNSLAEDLDFEIVCNTLVSVGEKVEVSAETSATNPQYSLSVVDKATSTACQTEGLAFRPTQIGVHTVKLTVQADEGTATKEKEIYVRKALQEGEVEVFDEDWLTVREYSPRYVAMEGTWTTTNTEQTGVKDADEKDGTYAVLETDAEYTHIYFNIRESRAYYRDLAMKGYTHIRFRIYVDSPTNRGKLFNWEHNATNSWRTSLGSAKANAWTDFYIPLTAGVAGTSDKKPGFVDSYEYYLSSWILLLDNSTGSWNANGREVDKDGNPLKFRIYFDDILAVRRTYETTVNTTMENDVYNLYSNLDRAWGTTEENYTYSVVKHTQYGTVKNTLVDKQPLTAQNVDLSGLMGNNGAYGSYEILYFIQGDNDDQFLYQRTWIDVMDESQKVYAHPDLHNFSNSKGLIYGYQDGTAKFTANPDGTMTYTTAGAWGAGLQIAPAYSLAYYNALKKEGYTALTFNLKLDVEYKEGASESVKALPYMICTLAQGQNGTTYQNGETHAISVSLDKIIQYYTTLQKMGSGWFAEYVLFHVQYGQTTDQEAADYRNKYSHSKLTFTISNFEMVK